MGRSGRLPSDFSDRIRSLRARLGLTQQALADRIDFSYVSVNRWENGQSRPNQTAWKRILELERPGDEREESESSVAVRMGAPPATDLSAASNEVRAVAEAERLTFGHLFNPTFATETSKIDPLPHQRIAVYERMLGQPRLRFLLADDAGAGKTIMSGLYVREMLSRRLIRRVLIIPPAGLVGNWERELRNLFNLSFRIVAGADCKSNNPFLGPDGNLVIVSVDTACDSRGRTFGRLADASTEPYDLVIFDEAHKLSADRNPDLTERKTDRYRLAEAIAGASTDLGWQLPWRAQHLVLLTATPHMGKDYPYFCLWRLLEPDVLTTIDAFNAYPAKARGRHFIRRTKEEMVRFDGTRIYPRRESNTLSYDLSPGEQELYDRTTEYMETFYNRARILNQSAARLAMSVFQRRLASSTLALLRSFERRLARLDEIIARVESGELTPEELANQQRRLADEELHDLFDECTGDEEEAVDDREGNEIAEDRALGWLGRSISELQAERQQVEELLQLAKDVYDAGEESKFEKLREVLRDPDFRDEKILIFTEHRDTLDFLVRRLEGLGFAGKVAQIHGGMHYSQREKEVERFRKSPEESGATYMVATDAAGEGINLQFSWLLVNYDIPWNPARIEQRFGRIHRYGQKHEPVLLFNLVAGKTREGRVLKRLLEKLEAIRKELKSDKVFDVIGRQFEGVSVKDLLLQSTLENRGDDALDVIEGILTPDQAKARMEQMERLLGTGGDVSEALPEQLEKVEREQLRRLMPGYVRRLIEESAPLLGINVEGDLDSIFRFRPIRTGALDALLPLIELQDLDRRPEFTVHPPRNGEQAIYLHPGEAVFDQYCALIKNRLGEQALRGGVFVDPYAHQPYFFHMAVVSASRRADETMRSDFLRPETVECRLVGIRDDEQGKVAACPVEHLLLLRGGQGIPADCLTFASTVNNSRGRALSFARDAVAAPIAESKRRILLDSLDERIRFIERGFEYQSAELAASRAKVSDRARSGDPRAKAELTKIKERQRVLDDQLRHRLAALRREPELIEPDDVRFIAHALVVPSRDPVDRQRHDRDVEQIAVRVAVGHEEARGCVVEDVSTAELARSAGLGDWPGFDLRSRHPDGEERAIEVKGRAKIGEIELSENEWAKACNLRGRYWLYVVYDCASAHPRLLKIRDPFQKLLVRAKGGVVIGEREVFDAAEPPDPHEPTTEPLPECLRSLFWDYDFDQLRWPTDRELVTARVLQNGNDEAVRWLRSKVDDSALSMWIRRSQGRGLDPKRLRFWQLMLKLPDQDVDNWINERRKFPQAGRFG